MIHKFYKDELGWAIDLPKPHPFSRAALAMVAGADTWLDILSQGENEVVLAIEDEYVEGYEKLVLTEYIGGKALSIFNGAMYMVKEYMGIEYNHSVFLCPVTLYVFKGFYPEIIYYKVLG